MGLSSSTKHCLTGCNEMALVRCPRRLPASELWLGIASTHRHAGGRPFKLLGRWARASGSCVAGSCGAALWTFPRDQCAKSFFIYKKIPLREYRASTGPQLQLLPPSDHHRHLPCYAPRRWRPLRSEGLLIRTSFSLHYTGGFPRRPPSSSPSRMPRAF